MGLGISSLWLGLHARGAGGFTPAALFANSEAGVWYDPSDLTSMYQGRTGTTAAAVDSPVGQLLDKSGNGNHAVAPTDAARPILRESGGLYYLEFDGTDDGLSVATFNMSSTDKLSIFTGLDKDSNSSQIVCELSSTVGTNTGTFFVVSGEDLVARYNSISRGSASVIGTQSAKFTATGYAPDTAIITAQHDISGDLSTIRRNGVAGTDGTADKGAGNFGSYTLFIGSRNNSSLRFSGNLYGLVIRGALTADVTNIESWMAAKTGVTL